MIQSITIAPKAGNVYMLISLYGQPKPCCLVGYSNVKHANNAIGIVQQRTCYMITQFVNQELVPVI